MRSKKEVTRVPCARPGLFKIVPEGESANCGPDGAYIYDLPEPIDCFGETFRGPFQFIVSRGKVIWTNAWEIIDKIDLFGSEFGGPATYGHKTFTFS